MLIRDSDIELKKIITPNEVTPKIGVLTLSGLHPKLTKVVRTDA